MRKDIMGTLKIAALVAVVFIAYLLKGGLVNPPAVDPDHAFDTRRSFERLERILGDQTPHPVDSAQSDAVIDRLVTEITALGFSPIIDDAFHCAEGWGQLACARIRNIKFWVTAPGPNAVMLLSHHDSVPAGPGASDDGAGVAASLEIAALMADRALERPLMVLITDGEELALLGANYFVAKDPTAQMIGAVVNMEARGVSGITSFFQTSRPNGRDLAALTSTTRLPAASSVNADIYELLPNDTDLTEFLGLNIDAANLAYSGDVAFYHTPGDTLENMDQRALFHLGSSGLAAAEAYLQQSGTEPETQRLYVDILGAYLLNVPLWFGLVCVILCAVLSGLLFWRERWPHPTRSFLAPPLAILCGVTFALVSTLFIGFFRSEAFFGAAEPFALRGLQAGAALTGALLVYTFVIKHADARALLASAWVWFAALALVVFFVVSGGLVIFVVPALLFGLAAALYLLEFKLPGRIFAGAGALLFALIVLPLSALGEVTLLIEGAAPFTLFPVLLLILALPLVWPKAGSVLRTLWIALTGTALVSAGFMIASFLVPAYDADTPRGMSLVHIQGEGYETPLWSVFGADPVPKAWDELASFEARPLPNTTAPRQLARAPAFETAGLTFEKLADTVTNDTRSVRLRFNAPDADRLRLQLTSRLSVDRLSVQGMPVPEDYLRLGRLVCQGRACRDLILEFDLPADRHIPDMNVISVLFGLGPESAPLLSARPAWTITRQDGDYRALVTKVVIDPEDASQSGDEE